MASNLWTNPTNWTGGAPSSAESDVRLVFPAGVANLTNINDLNGLNVKSIELSGNGYTITGNSIVLGAKGITDSSVAGLDTIGLDLVLPAGKHTLAASQLGATLRIDGTLSGAGGLTKTGKGVVSLSGANTFGGAVTVAAGFLDVQSSAALGATTAGTTVLDKATLLLEGGINVAEPLTLFGIGVNPLAGAMRNLVNSNAWTGPVKLQATPTATSVVVEVSSGSLQLQGAISGSAGLTKTGAGVLILNGTTPNSYAGTTRVNGGDVQLIKSSGVTAIPHALVIGDGDGGVDADRVVLFANNQIADKAPITLTASGKLDLNGNSETIGPLTFHGGNIEMGAGTLTLNGNIAANGTSFVFGNLNLGPSTRTINVSKGGHLTVWATISGGGGLTKTGVGTLTLEVNNSYSGVTTVRAGILQIDSNGALGSTAAGTTVLGGATLEALDFISDTNEPLTLSGAGFGGLGALSLRKSFNSSDFFWNGPITLASNGAAVGNNSIISVFGFLDLNGAIDGSGGLTLLGSGEIDIGGGSANTYQGKTTVKHVVVILKKPAGVTAIPHDLIIGNGGRVGLNADDLIADSATVTLNSPSFFSLGNHNETIHRLKMLGGSLSTGTGTLTVK
jgi:fibronectin-binding autotransporter adhesin